MKNKYDIPSGRKIIFSCRNFEPLYRIDRLIRAVKEVIKKDKNILVLIAGSGSLENNLKKLCRDNGLEDYIRFLGKIEYTQIPDYHFISDVYVSTSTSDGVSSSNMEALLSYSIPILSNIPASRLLVKDAVNGYIFENSYLDLSSKILSALEDLEKAPLAYLEINREFSKKFYSWNKNVSDMENLFIKAIEDFKK